MSTKTLYERLGGYDAIAAVADNLLPHLQADPQTGSLLAARARIVKTGTGSTTRTSPPKDCFLLSCFSSRSPTRERSKARRSSPFRPVNDEAFVEKCMEALILREDAQVAKNSIGKFAARKRPRGPKELMV